MILSDEIMNENEAVGWLGAIPTRDVKKTIKDILGEFRRRFYGSNITTKDYDEFLEFIEQRVGRKLT